MLFIAAARISLFGWLILSLINIKGIFSEDLAKILRVSTCTWLSGSFTNLFIFNSDINLLLFSINLDKIFNPTIFNLHSESSIKLKISLSGIFLIKFISAVISDRANGKLLS